MEAASAREAGGASALPTTAASSSAAPPERVPSTARAISAAQVQAQPAPQAAQTERKKAFRNMPGIPMPKHSGIHQATIFAWVLSVILLVGGVIRVTDRYVFVEERPLSPGMNLEFLMTDCDIVFRETEDSETPHLLVRYWTPLHAAFRWNHVGKNTAYLEPVTAEGDLLRVNITMARKLKYFQCVAKVVLDGSTPLGKVNILQAKSVSYNLVSSSHPLLKVDDLSVQASYGEFAFRGLQVTNKVKLGVDDGRVSLNFPTPSCGKAPMQISSKLAPVSVRVAGGMALDIAEPSQGLAVLAASGSASPTMLHAASGPTKCSVKFVGVEAVLYALADERWMNGGTKKLQRWSGQDQPMNRLALTPASIDKIKKVQKWRQSMPQAPFVIFLDIVDPGLPMGLWRFMSSPVYLFVSLEWFVVLSFGFLSPRMQYVDLHIVGLPQRWPPTGPNQLFSPGDVGGGETDKGDARGESLDNVDVQTERRLAQGGSGDADDGNEDEEEEEKTSYSGGNEDPDMYWNAQIFNAVYNDMNFSSISTLMWKPVGRPGFLYNVEDKVVSSKEVHWTDQWLFALCSVLNLIAAVILAASALGLMATYLVPYLLEKLDQQKAFAAFSYRVEFAHEDHVRGKWRLTVITAEAKRHGVMVRWLKRPRRAEFSVYNVELKEETKGKLVTAFSFSIPKDRITTPQEAPQGAELLISAQHPNDTLWAKLVHKLTSPGLPPGSHVRGEPWHPQLKIGASYRCRITGLNNKFAIVEASEWSDLFTLQPPMTVADVPFMALRTFLPPDFSEPELFLNTFVDSYATEKVPVVFDSLKVAPTVRKPGPDGKWKLEVFWGASRQKAIEQTRRRQLRLDPVSTISYCDTEFEWYPSGGKKADSTITAGCGGYMPLACSDSGVDAGQELTDTPTAIATGEAEAVYIKHKNVKLERTRQPTCTVVLSQDEASYAVGEINYNQLATRAWGASGFKNESHRVALTSTQNGRPWGQLELKINRQAVNHLENRSDEIASKEDRPVFFGLPPGWWLPMGTPFVIRWNTEHEKLMVGGRKADKVRLRLCEDGFLASPMPLSADATEIVPNTGSYPWIATAQLRSTAAEKCCKSEAQSGNVDKLCFVIEPENSHGYGGGQSNWFFVTRTELVTDVELAYGAFVKQHGLEMAAMSEDILWSERRIAVAPVLLSVVSDVREPLPFERDEAIMGKSPDGTARGDILMQKGQSLISASRVEIQDVDQAEPILSLAQPQMRKEKVLQQCALSQDPMRWTLSVDQFLFHKGVQYSPQIKAFILGVFQGSGISMIASNLSKALSMVPLVGTYLQAGVDGVVERIGHRFFFAFCVPFGLQVALFMMQFIFMLLPVILVVVFTLVVNYFQHAVYPGFHTSRQSSYVADFVFNPSWHACFELPLVVQIAFSCSAGYSILMMLLLGFLNLFPSGAIFLLRPIASGLKVLTAMWVFFLLVFVFTSMLWSLLGALINPDVMLPYAAATTSAVAVVKSLWTELTNLRKTISEFIADKLDMLLGMLLNTLFESLGLSIEDLDKPGGGALANEATKMVEDLRSKLKTTKKDFIKMKAAQKVAQKAAAEAEKARQKVRKKREKAQRNSNQKADLDLEGMPSMDEGMLGRIFQELAVYDRSKQAWAIPPGALPGVQGGRKEVADAYAQGKRNISQDYAERYPPDTKYNGSYIPNAFGAMDDLPHQIKITTSESGLGLIGSFVDPFSSAEEELFRTLIQPWEALVHANSVAYKAGESIVGDLKFEIRRPEEGILGDICTAVLGPAGKAAGANVRAGYVLRDIKRSPAVEGADFEVMSKHGIRLVEKALPRSGCAICMKIGSAWRDGQNNNYDMCKSCYQWMQKQAPICHAVSRPEMPDPRGHGYCAVLDCFVQPNGTQHLLILRLHAVAGNDVKMAMDFNRAHLRYRSGDKPPIMAIAASVAKRFSRNILGIVAFQVPAEALRQPEPALEFSFSDGDEEGPSGGAWTGVQLSKSIMMDMSSPKADVTLDLVSAGGIDATLNGTAVRLVVDRQGGKNNLFIVSFHRDAPFTLGLERNQYDDDDRSTVVTDDSSEKSDSEASSASSEGSESGESEDGDEEGGGDDDEDEDMGDDDVEDDDEADDEEAAQEETDNALNNKPNAKKLRKIFEWLVAEKSSLQEASQVLTDLATVATKSLQTQAQMVGSTLERIELVRDRHVNEALDEVAIAELQKMQRSVLDSKTQEDWVTRMFSYDWLEYRASCLLDANFVIEDSAPQLITDPDVMRGLPTLQAVIAEALVTGSNATATSSQPQSSNQRGAELGMICDFLCEKKIVPRDFIRKLDKKDKAAWSKKLPENDPNQHVTRGDQKFEVSRRLVRLIELALDEVHTKLALPPEKACSLRELDDVMVALLRTNLWQQAYVTLLKSVGIDFTSVTFCDTEEGLKQQKAAPTSNPHPSILMSLRPTLHAHSNVWMTMGSPSLAVGDGSWYYEVWLGKDTFGPQIGWAVREFQSGDARQMLVEGIGDDQFGWGCDPQRNKLWHDGPFADVNFVQSNNCYVGCAIHYSGNHVKMDFYLNGVQVDGASFTDIKGQERVFYPAFTIAGGFKVNYGPTFAKPPEGLDAKPLYDKKDGGGELSRDKADGIRRLNAHKANMERLDRMWNNQTEQMGGLLPMDQLIELTSALTGYGISKGCVQRLLQKFGFCGYIGIPDFGLAELRASATGAFASASNTDMASNFHFVIPSWENFGKDNARKKDDSTSLDDRVADLEEMWKRLTRDTGGFITQSQLLVFVRDLTVNMLAVIKKPGEKDDFPVCFEHFNKLLGIMGYPLPRAFAKLCWITISEEINPAEGEGASKRVWPCGLLPFNAEIKDWLKENLLQDYCTKATFVMMLKRMGMEIPEKAVKEMWLDLRKSPIKNDKFPTAIPLGIDTVSHDFTKGILVRYDDLFRPNGGFSKLLSTGLWPSAVNIVVTQHLRLPVPIEKLHEALQHCTPNRYGLYRLTDMVKILRSFSTSGMSYETLKKLMQKMNIQVHEKSLRRTFELMDINKDQVLDEEEFLAGINVLFSKLLPDVILQMAGLEVDQILVVMSEVLFLLAILFAFVLIAFQGFVGVGGGLGSVIQSLLAAFAALYTKASYSKDVKETTAMVQHLVYKVLNLSPEQVEQGGDKGGGKGEGGGGGGEAAKSAASAKAASPDAAKAPRLRNIRFDTTEAPVVRQGSGPCEGLDVIEFSALESKVNLKMVIMPQGAQHQPLNFRVRPKLPSGLSLDPKTGNIVGRATGPAIIRSYMVTCSTQGNGSATTKITFRVSQCKWMPRTFAYQAPGADQDDEPKVCSNHHPLDFGIPWYKSYGCDGRRLRPDIVQKNGGVCNNGGEGKRWHCEICSEDYCLECFKKPVNKFVISDGETVSAEPKIQRPTDYTYQYIFKMEPSFEEVMQGTTVEDPLSVSESDGRFTGTVPEGYAEKLRKYRDKLRSEGVHNSYLARTGNACISVRLIRKVFDQSEPDVLSKRATRCKLRFKK